MGKVGRGGKPWKHKWISNTSRDWDRGVEGFREHIAVDGSLKEVSGRKEQTSGNLCRTKETGRKHRSESCKDLRRKVQMPEMRDSAASMRQFL